MRSRARTLRSKKAPGSMPPNSTVVGLRALAPHAPHGTGRDSDSASARAKLYGILQNKQKNSTHPKSGSHSSNDLQESSFFFLRNVGSHLYLHLGSWPHDGAPLSLGSCGRSKDASSGAGHQQDTGQGQGDGKAGTGRK